MHITILLSILLASIATATQVSPPTEPEPVEWHLRRCLNTYLDGTCYRFYTAPEQCYSVASWIRSTWYHAETECRLSCRVDGSLVHGVGKDRFIECGQMGPVGTILCGSCDRPGRPVVFYLPKPVVSDGGV